MLVLAVIIVLYKAIKKVYSPFEKFTPYMTKEEVHTELGEPDDSYSQHDFVNCDDYHNVSIARLIGELTVWYTDEDIISSASWEYNSEEGENISDYSKQAVKSKNILTKTMDHL